MWEHGRKVVRSVPFAAKANTAVRLYAATKYVKTDLERDRFRIQKEQMRC